MAEARIFARPCMDCGNLFESLIVEHDSERYVCAWCFEYRLLRLKQAADTEIKTALRSPMPVPPPLEEWAVVEGRWRWFTWGLALGFVVALVVLYLLGGGW